MQRFKRLRVRWPLMGSNPPNVRLANCLGRRWFRKLGAPSAFRSASPASAMNRCCGYSSAKLGRRGQTPAHHVADDRRGVIRKYAWHRRHVDWGIRLCGFHTLGRLSWRPRSHFSSRVDRSTLKPKTTLSVLVFWKEGKMKTKVTTLAALISSVLLSSVQAVAAQTNPPPGATATRPAKTPPEQTSVPNASPPATTTQTTGENSRDPTVKKMNEDEKKKVDTTGK
jgi:hypothetical protein